MNGNALVDAVGALLNVENPDTDTIPTSAQIETWLNMAQDIIVRNVPAEDVQSLWDTVGGTLELGSGVARVHSVLLDGQYPARFVPRDMFEKLKHSAELDGDKAIWTYASRRDTIDEYWDTGYTGLNIYQTVNGGIGQCFQADESCTLSRVRFRLMTNAAIASSETLYVYLYSMAAGTYGTDGNPGSGPVALAVAEISGDTLIADGLYHDYWFEFDSNNAYTMAAGNYCACIQPAGTVSATCYVAVDTSSPSHDGNGCIKTSGVWSGSSSVDTLFEVVGVASLASTDAHRVTIDVAPESQVDNYMVTLIRRPQDITDDATRPTFSLPDIYDQELILYAVAMAKVQDEEMADAQYLMQLFGAILGRGNLPDEAVRDQATRE